jgi:malto-oligosyltrehalose trehalohydrolase
VPTGSSPSTFSERHEPCEYAAPTQRSLRRIFEFVEGGPGAVEITRVTIMGTWDEVRMEGGTGRRSLRFMTTHGANLLDDGQVRFRLWAPACDSVQLELQGIEKPMHMQRGEGGWYELVTNAAQAHSRYRYALPDGTRVPDPASRFQPDDVHGMSEVIDPLEYRWQLEDWSGRPWCEIVVYELHVGTFTSAGTFVAAIEKLDYLVELGVTAIEIMPVADFPGRYNWGYDGVLLYAPDSTYGRPEDFKALIDAAHARGLCVLLDVVYNHFGPDGNYLHLYAPDFFTDRHKTPWGAAVNYDGESSAPVREFVIQNALYWLGEFRLDGLRLDAVHAIIDDSEKHLLVELGERVRSAFRGRHVHLVLENEHNAASLLARDDAGRPLWYTAQWNDDVHHVLHTAATGERNGYYRDYAGDTEMLGRALAEGFAFQGQAMKFSGRARGEPSAGLTALAFVAFIQNHDQIGNRAFGERIGALTTPEAIRAIAAVYLMLPQVPMLFMGEEWNASQPFPFFCDFSGDLAKAVREGRRQEFAAFPEFRDPEKREAIPDPQAAETFASAKLDWDALTKEVHGQWHDWYRRILQVRAAQLVPRLSGIVRGGSYTVLGPCAVTVRWEVPDGALVLDANLSSHEVSARRAASGRMIWSVGTVDSDTLGPWSVRWSIEPSATGS